MRGQLNSKNCLRLSGINFPSKRREMQFRTLVRLKFSKLQWPKSHAQVFAGAPGLGGPPLSLPKRIYVRSGQDQYSCMRTPLESLSYCNHIVLLVWGTSGRISLNKTAHPFLKNPASLCPRLGRNSGSIFEMFLGGMHVLRSMARKMPEMIASHDVLGL